MARITRRLATIALMALWCTGCLSSPTLPLPPPSPDEPTVPVDGHTRLSGSVPSSPVGVRVLALNLRSNLIYGEGTVSLRFSFLAEAQSGDTFVMWYVVGDEVSEAAEVVVPFPPPAANAPSGSEQQDGGCSGCRDAQGD